MPAAAGHSLNRRRDCIQAAVTFLMPGAIIDTLEPIKIYKHDSDEIAVGDISSSCFPNRSLTSGRFIGSSMLELLSHRS